MTMPDKPQIETLSLRHRNRLFLLLVSIFLLVLPAMIFYTTGYRLDFANDEQTIVSTGGIYVTTDNLEVEVYLDDTQVEQPRLFRSAYYIQNITAGQHRVVVQRPDLTTWVKELPVDAHIVIEAAAFNMPKIPHVRPITKYVTATGTPVYVGVATSTELFTQATTTVPVLITSSKRTTAYVANEEYVFVESLFGTTTMTERSVFTRVLDEVDRFTFSTTTDSVDSTTELIIERNNIRLVPKEQELFAVWVGSNSNNIPHYFCVTKDATSTIAARYGEHVGTAIDTYSHSTSTPLVPVGDRVCRPEIMIDRLRKDVYFYDFFPGSSDLVLLQLEDGLYVTEIDDRSWQNVQQIYSGTDLQVVVENGVIYVRDGGYYFEVITELELR
jgi:hypothetical protein